MNTFDFYSSGNCVHYATPIATTPAEHVRLEFKRLLAMQWLDQRLSFSPRCFAARADSRVRLSQ